MNSDASVSGFEYSDDAFDPVELVTNDVVGREPVKPTGNYAGPEGSEPSRRLPSTRSTHPTQKTARTTWMASSRNASGPASSFGHGASERTDSRGSIEYLKLDGVAGSGRDPRLADTRHQSVQIDILPPVAPRSFECP